MSERPITDASERRSMMIYPDAELAGRIEEALLMNPFVSQQELEVSAREHVVTLRGTVSSADRKQLALAIAHNSPMCRGVVDEVRVVRCGALSDGEASANAVRQLDSLVPCVRDAARVSVKAGVANITGTVPTEWERMVAADVVLAAKGVHSVLNRMRTRGGYDLSEVPTIIQRGHARRAARPPRSQRIRSRNEARRSKR